MNWIEVISVGPGDTALMTLEARQALDRAQTVCCAQRHRALVPPGVPVIPMLPLEDALPSLAAQREAGLRTAVLVSGDAGIYSLLGLLVQRFGRDALHVLPGVSALQAFFAAMKRPWQAARVLSAHGRALSPSALCHAVRTERETVLFLDDVRDPHWVREVLARGGLAHARMTVGDRLSYADERVDAYEPGRAYPPLCMVLVENDAPESGLPKIGLADESFCRGKTPMTKQEIRVQVLSALGLAPDSVVWDVGAGTGSVSVELALAAHCGRVYAVECEADACALIRRNRERFGAWNMTPVQGRAPEALAGLPAPDVVFIGGTGGGMAGVVDAALARSPSARICISAIALETLSAAAAALTAHGLAAQVTQIAVSRTRPAGGLHLLMANNPVFLVTGNCE